MEKLLDKIIEKHTLQKTLIIGIDGLGGSGKTTIANSLKQELSNKNYNSVILHIDDFIHPRNIRYDEAKEEWYCYYYIQWRYDYLIKEILMPIKEGIEIDKQIELYDKDNDIYILEQIKIPRGSILLLEGIFLQRKEIREYFDYIVYLDTPKRTRLNRVINRDKYIGNLEDINLKYERRYFPAEDKYIEEYHPMDNADFVLNYVINKEENVYIKTIDSYCNSQAMETIESLARVLCFEEPEMMEISKQFWIDWLDNKIEGEKITVVAQEINEDNDKKFVGVVRFWKTPYCNNKWLVEGLEVILPERRKGIGKSMVQYGLEILIEMGVKEVSVHIRNNNIASIRLHESLGFIKVSSGSINSFGDFREHIDEYVYVVNQ